MCADDDVPTVTGRHAGKADDSWGDVDVDAVDDDDDDGQQGAWNRRWWGGCLLRACRRRF